MPPVPAFSVSTHCRVVNVADNDVLAAIVSVRGFAVDASDQAVNVENASGVA